MRAACWVLLGVLLLVPPGAAQQLEPEVRFPDLTIEEPIEPLGQPGEATVALDVGCAASENPSTLTAVVLRTTDEPAFVDPVISPASLTRQSQPGDCPNTEPPIDVESSLRVALTQNAPAFEPVTLGLDAVVWKNDTDEFSNRYGPYSANVTFTPGYFNLYNVRQDTKIAQIGAGQTARFEGTIDNFSNARTLFSLRTVEPVEGLSIEYEPAELEIEPSENASFAIVVEGEATLTRTNHQFQTLVTSRSAAPDGPSVAGSNSTLAMTVQVGGYADSGPGPVVIAIFVLSGVAAGVLAWRRSR